MTTEAAKSSLRPTYTVKQFAVEALGGNRCTEWVLRQIRKGKIRAVSRRPYLIPRSEAERFTNPS
jgi:hypothetical protein